MNLEKLKPYEQKDGIRKSSLSPFPPPKCCKLGLEWYKNFHLSYGVGFLDCLIAATAYEKNVPIATLNDKHFKQLTDITIIRPY